MSMSAGIAGSRRRWDKDIVSQTNATIVGELSGAPTTRPIRANIQSGETVGAVSGDALAAGDLSSFVSVDCRIYGKTYGFGGAASGGNAGHAIDGNDQSNLTINLETGGEIRGGGGGGGVGGLAGHGEGIGGITNRCYVNKYDQYGFGGGTSDPNYGVYWIGSYKGLGFATGLVNGGYKYAVYNCNNPGFASLSGVGRYQISSYNNGYGGAGGTGQGYNQSPASGNVGTNGTAGCGTGGTGGLGANWGTAGASGNVGGTGYTYATNGTLSVPRSGDAGSSGGAAGKAAYNMTGVTLNNNGGTISGATS